MSNELATANTFAIVPMTDDIKQMIQEEMAGLGQIPFDTINIPAGGALAFEVPGDDPEHPETVAKLTGIIVYHHPVNAYWRDSYTGGSQAPDCSSFDGMIGVWTETGETCRCDQCPYNQFGSGKDGAGKACKNGHRIYLLRDGEMLPVLLSLPPTSLKPFKEYLAKRLLTKGLRPSHVLTEVSLVKDTNAGGIKYSKCSFKKAGELTSEQKAMAESMTASIKAIAGNVTIEDAPMDAPYETVPEGEYPEF